MSLREAIFAAAAGEGHLFEAGRWTLAFVGESYESERMPVEWEVLESAVRAVVPWRMAASGQRVHSHRLYDGGELVETRRLRDGDGHTGDLSTFAGMEFVYRYTFGFGEGSD